MKEYMYEILECSTEAHDEAADVDAEAGEQATMAKSTSHKPSRLANATDSLSLQVNHLALRILFCAINAKRSAFTFARPSDQRLVAEPASLSMAVVLADVNFRESTLGYTYNNGL